MHPSSLDRFLRLVRRAAEGWALAGGLLLLAVVLVTAASLAGNLLFGQPIAGDFEIVEVGVAVAVFAFLPYCQATGSNVTADIFTSRASRRWQAVFALVGALVALGFSLLLFWRMALGLVDFREYEEVTTIYQFPLWIAFLPILVSLALLVVAAGASLLEAGRASLRDGPAG